ncbi:MAG: methylenetetrahydrofolate dehydrogenase (NADP+)/methenyltetrahydrofolate cyclohydrolase [Kiritimatiellia bacterium]|jgi:methylenetetrahydrofolate dehydrogenase (NADP+)/methenyltetrahydrofolate cyclohydrolase
MAHLLDGSVLSKRLNKDLKRRAAKLSSPPSLAVVLVGSDAGSQVYVRRKGIVAGRIGFGHRQIDLPVDTTQQHLESVVDELANDAGIDGILVQMPLPAGLDANAVMDRIPSHKDVDGFTPPNTGLLSQGRAKLIACTPLGVMQMLHDANISLSGKHAVVIGRSNIVGRPMAMLLEQANCTVTICHSRTPDVAAQVARADVVVAAVGRPRMVLGEWIKPGAAVIDVGMNRLDDGTLCGDVDFDSAKSVAGWITPVPRGVGPMTIAMLMENTYRSACERQGVIPLAAFADMDNS